MRSENTQLPEIMLVGITARTNNAAEMNPATAKIGSTLQKYFQGALQDKIKDRKNAGTTYCVYTDYESDYTGNYTYFVGEEVTSFDQIPDGFSAIKIPFQHYTKFTNDAGVMPDVCINMWQKIWQMSSSDFGGDREYLADFELYDSRALNPQSTVLDIFVGVKKSLV